MSIEEILRRMREVSDAEASLARAIDEMYDDEEEETKE